MAKLKATRLRRIGMALAANASGSGQGWPNIRRQQGSMTRPMRLWPINFADMAVDGGCTALESLLPKGA